MIPLTRFLQGIQSIRAAQPTYRLGGSGVDGTCDCIGLIIGAILAQVLSILVLTGVLDVAKQDTINAVIVAALQVLVAFGVLNNPKDGEHF